MSWDWVAAVIVLVSVAIMIWHVGQLHRAWRREDVESLQQLLRTTMPLVGGWLIILGMSLIFVGDDTAWFSTIILIGSGFGVLLLNWVGRKFEVL